MFYWDADIWDINTFCEQGNELICFGSGVALQTFTNFLESNGGLVKVRTVVDNEVTKQGASLKCINDIWYDVISIDALLKLDLNRIAIVITTSYLEEILKQLSQYTEMNSVPVVYYGFVMDNFMHNTLLNASEDILEIPQGKDIIPRVIHYCWFGGKEMPKQYKKWMESWNKLCPDYEIVRWDETNYDVHKIPYISEAYNCKKYSFVSDYARFDILYRYGGIYLDTDVEVLRPLNPLLCQRAFMGTEFPSNMVATGLGMGAVPKHEGIKMLMEDYLDRHFLREDGTLDLTTCPVIQSNTLASYGFNANGKRQSIKGIEIYPNITFSPFLPYSRRIVYNKISYLCHHYAGSWVEEKNLSKAKAVSDIYKLFKKGRPNI